MLLLRTLLLVLFASLTVSAQQRVPWTTSRISGSPEPPPAYVAEAVWPHLQFTKALDIARLPSRDLIFVTEQKGKIWILPADLNAKPGAPELFANLNADLAEFESVFSIAFHPEFETKREVYVFYRTGIKLEEGTRISRFQVADDALRLEPASEEILLTWLSGGHNGGHLGFGPDGMLYVLAGDAEVPSPPDPLNTGQDTSDLLSSVLRIDVDRRDPGRTFAIPPDNPFLDLSPTRPEIWAYGFRNPWKLCFHPRTGDLWVADVGWELWELLYRVERGANYGWSIVEGPQPIKPLQDMGPSTISPPTHYYGHDEGASITGGYVYESSRLPDLEGAYLYGDFVTGRMWGLWHDGEHIQRNEIIADTRMQIVSFGQAGDGEVIFLNWPNEQHLYRLVPNPDLFRPGQFPTQLSETGLFAETGAQQASPGVYEFQINAPMWQDEASARYWLGLPGEERVKTTQHRINQIPMFRHQKPEGMVLAKTLERDGRTIETQILHFDGTWNGYSYAWNEDETDATLVGPSGEDRLIDGRPWRFHSRAECARCHNGNFTQTLAFLPGQLSRGGQLERFHALGLVDDGFLKGAEVQPLASPYDETQSVAARARSWLHANCSHCHRFSGGGSVPIHLTAEAPLDLTGTLGIDPVKGGFGLDAPQLIAPGDPANSVLYYRSATAGIGHMPMFGAKTIDDTGLRALHDWIAALGPEPDTELPTSPETPTQALILLHAYLAGQLSPETATTVIEAGKASPNLAISGLFQRFLPVGD